MAGDGGDDRTGGGGGGTGGDHAYWESWQPYCGNLKIKECKISFGTYVF